MRILRALLFILAAVLAFPAAATFHLWVFNELYSNADGSIQFVVVQSPADFEDQLAGRQLMSTDGTTTHTIVFPNNVPSSSTAGRSVLIATPGFAALGIITPDYTMPEGFLFTNGGRVVWATSFDQWTYAALPTDGVNALYRDGTTHQNLAINFAGAMASVVAPPLTVTAVEYHHAIFDHYFITPKADEIALLDAHAPPFQDWSRTGFTFNVYVNATAPAGSVAICRFFNDHFAPKSSHFYGPRGGSCDVTLVKFPDWKLEEDKLFNAMLSDMTGACPAGTIPVYRLYNNGMGGAPNHRFVTSLAEQQNMRNQGWTPEGNGIGVETCVPG